VVILITGAVVESPIMARLAKAAEANGDGPPSDELARQMSRSRLGLLTVASAVLYAAVIFVMVFKPLS